jgi:hypothetical protein
VYTYNCSHVIRKKAFCSYTLRRSQDCMQFSTTRGLPCDKRSTTPSSACEQQA